MFGCEAKPKKKKMDSMFNVVKCFYVFFVSVRRVVRNVTIPWRWELGLCGGPDVAHAAYVVPRSHTGSSGVGKHSELSVSPNKQIVSVSNIVYIIVLKRCQDDDSNSNNNKNFWKGQKQEKEEENRHCTKVSICKHERRDYL